MAELPTGTVTFLFTDIAGSTVLWEQHPQAMPDALARHDAILRAAIAAHGGAIFHTAGDAFCTAFAGAPAALASALAASARSRPNPGARAARCGCAWRCTLERSNCAMAITSARRSTAPPA